MNKTSIFIIIISIIVIFSCAFFKTVREGLTNNDTIVLIGDSILNNAAYVPPNQSVVHLLKEKTPRVYSFAKEGATIQDCYNQLDQVPIDVNNSKTYVFISVGGNNILNSQGQMDSASIKKLFVSYMDFVNALRAKLSSVNINIFNLYMPTDPRFQSYKPSIDEWNKLIQENSFKVGAMYNVMDIASLLTSPDDFVYNIEPSTVASEKIANMIYLTQ